MRPVITISLNGNAYQIEQGGYEALRAYLATADARLAGNPDRTEILADLEQAIAEKCSGFLAPHKSVVTDEEIAQVLHEMGPVDGGTEAGAPGPGQTGAESTASPNAGEPRHDTRDTRSSKRLYQIREGAMISGVCNGLAAYFGIDVTIVRLIFVVLALLTGGVWVIAYLVMMFVIPYAETSEERAAAHGWQFNAQELIDRAKQHYAQFKDSQQWRRRWREERRFWRFQQRAWRAQARSWRRAEHSCRDMPPYPESRAADVGYAAHLLGGLLAPFVALFSALLFAALVIAIISLLSSHAILGWAYPGQLPVWVGIVFLVLLYAIVVSPLRSVHHLRYHSSPAAGWVAMWGALVWLALLTWLGLLAWHHWPQVQHWLTQISHALQHLTVPRDASGTSV